MISMTRPGCRDQWGSMKQLRPTCFQLTLLCSRVVNARACADITVVRLPVLDLFSHLLLPVLPHVLPSTLSANPHSTRATERAGEARAREHLGHGQRRAEPVVATQQHRPSQECEHVPVCTHTVNAPRRAHHGWAPSVEPLLGLA
jgi:hypothetical protein